MVVVAVSVNCGFCAETGNRVLTADAGVEVFLRLAFAVICVALGNRMECGSSSDGRVSDGTKGVASSFSLSLSSSSSRFANRSNSINACSRSGPMVGIFWRSSTRWWFSSLKFFQA